MNSKIFNKKNIVIFLLLFFISAKVIFAGDLKFNTNGGNVGIGTTAPAETLEVQNANTTGTTQTRLRITDTDSGENPELQFQYDTTNHWAIYADKTNNNALTVWRANNLFTILSTGNVGIGTTAPATKLDVNGSVRVVGSIGVGTSTPTTKIDVVGGGIRTDSSVTTPLVFNQDFITLQSGTNNINLTPGTGMYVDVTQGTFRAPAILQNTRQVLDTLTSGNTAITISGANNSRTITFKTCAANETLIYDGTNWVCSSSGFIAKAGTGDGGVGIPSGGTIIFNATYGISYGRVGNTITFTPVYGSTANTIAQGNTAINVNTTGNLTGGATGTAGGGLNPTLNTVMNPTFTTSVTTPVTYGSSAASGTLTLESTSNATKGNVIINPNGGNVGIGTTNPLQKLQVNGSIYANGGMFYVNGGSGLVGSDGVNGFYPASGTNGITIKTNSTDRLKIDDSGNVGINTTSPSYKLDVNGIARATTVIGSTAVSTPLISNGGNISITPGTGTNTVDVTQGTLTAPTIKQNGVQVLDTLTSSSSAITVSGANNSRTLGFKSCAANETLIWTGTDWTCIASGFIAKAGYGDGGAGIPFGGTLILNANNGISYGRTNNTITFGLTNTGVASGTYPKVTVDATGRVTYGFLQIDLTKDVSNVLPITYGGTNNNTFSNGQVTYYNGTSLTGNSGLFYDSVNNYLGVGTSSPSSPLTVSNDLASSTTTLTVNKNNAGATGNIAEFKLNGSNKSYITYSGRLYTTSDIEAGGYFVSANGLTGGVVSNSLLLTGSTGTVISRNVADANTALKVNQINAGSTGNILDLQTAGVSKFIVSYGGNVGVGTTNPSAKMSIIDNSVGIDLGQTTGTAKIVGYNGSSYNDLDIRSTGTKGSGIYLNTAGSVGINTTSPSYKLDVNGIARATSVIGTNSVTTPLILSNNGDLSLTPSSASYGVNVTQGTFSAPKIYQNTLQVLDTLTSGNSAITISGANNSRTATFKTCAANETLEYDGTDWVCVTSGFVLKSNSADGGAGIGQGDSAIITSNSGITYGRVGNTITFGLANSGITPGTYPKVNVDTYGRATYGYGQINLTTDVSGILPVANGGTNASSFTSGQVTYYDGTRLTGSNNLYYDSINNRLGIGTNIPGSTLQTSNTTGANLFTLAKYGAANYTWAINSGNSLALETNYLVVNSSGNVGIGTASPSYKLDVSASSRIGNGTAATILQVSGLNAGTNIISNSDQGATINLQNSNSTSNNYEDIRFTNSAGSGIAGIVGINVDHTTNAGDLAFTTRVASGSLSEKMRITGSGRVGIGTNSPQNILDIRGSDAIEQIGVDNSNKILIGWTSSSSPNYGKIQTILGGTYAGNLALQSAGGSVGIGTSSPSSKLDVVGGGIRTDSSVTTPLVFSNSGNLSLTPTTASYGVNVTQGYFNAPIVKQNNVQVIDTLTSSSSAITVSGSDNSRTLGFKTCAANETLIWNGTDWACVASGFIAKAGYGDGGAGIPFGGTLILDANNGITYGRTSNTITFSPVYGSTANTIAQGNTAINVNTTGNLTGGATGTAGGGLNPTLNTVMNPTFTTSVTTPVTYGSSTASGILTLESTSNATKGNVIINPTSGNVGIRTTTPGAVLDVGGTTGINGDLIRMSSVAGSYHAIGNYSGNELYIQPHTYFNVLRGYSYTSTNRKMNSADVAIKVTNNAIGLALDTGNVGIGTVSPSAKLDVMGGVKATNVVTPTISNTTEISILPGTGYGVGVNKTPVYGRELDVNGEIYQNGYQVIDDVIAGGGISVAGSANTRTVSLSNSGVTAGTYPKVVVDTYGRVTYGYGTINLTTDVSGVLPVVNGGTNATSFTSGQVTYFDGTRLTGNNNLYYDSTNARVGIGTTTPGTRLDVIGAANGSPATTGTSQPNASMRISNSITGGTLDIGENSGTGWLQATNKTDLSQAYTISLNPNGGNVGIGTTSPSHKLTINNGANYSSGLNITDGTKSVNMRMGSSAGTLYLTSESSDIVLLANNAEKMRIASGGSVGIGTASASARLDVVGGGIKTDSSVTTPLVFSNTGDLSLTPTTASYGVNVTQGYFNAPIVKQNGTQVIDTLTSGNSAITISGANNSRTATFKTCAANETLKYNGTDWICVTAGFVLKSNSGDGGAGIGPGDSATITSSSGISYGRTGNTITFTPVYGSTANTIAQGNTAINVNTTGNLTGGATGTAGGGLNPTLNTVMNPTFTTSVTTPVTYGSSTASGTLTLKGTSNATYGNVLVNPTGGNVAIGNSSPTEKLDVTGNIKSSGMISGTTIIGSTAVISPTVYGGQNASDNLTLDSTLNSTKGNIVLAPTTGNVGIGTTTPSAKLEVNGGIKVANNNWISAVDSTGTGIVNMFKVNTNNEIEVGGTLNVGTLSLAEDSGAVTLVNMPVSATPTAGTEESYSFSIDSNVIAKIYSESDGLGGIQNPALVVNGAIKGATWNGNTVSISYGGTGLSSLCSYGKILKSDGTNYYCGTDIGDGNGQWLLNGNDTYYNLGKVGIGTSGPVEKLHIYDGNVKIQQTTNTDAYITLNPYSTGLGSTYQWNLVGSNSSNSYSFQIREGANNYLTIGNSAGTFGGRVGIGTTAPANKLDVSGNISASGFVSGTTLSGSVAVTAPLIQQNGVQVIDTTTAGGGISISGSTNSRTISLSNSGVTAGTYPKVTVDTYGRVTTGTTLSASDIPSLDTSKLTTGTLPIARGGLGLSTICTNGQILKSNGTSYYCTADVGSGYGQWGVTGSDIYYTDGDVGIGTGTPTIALDILKTGVANTPLTMIRAFNDIPYSSGYGLGAARIELGHNKMHGYIEAGSYSETDSSGGYLAIGHLKNTNITEETIRIANTGRVGIGTTTPANALDVTGNISASGFVSGTTLSGSVAVTAPLIQQNGVQVIDTTTAGGGISISGSTNSRTISLSNSGVTAGTYPKVTVDTYGRVTTGTTLSASDIPSLDTSKLTTGTLPIARGGTNSTSYTASQFLWYNGTSLVASGYGFSSFLNSASGTSNYVPKFTSANTIGNSLVYDNGTNVGIGITSPGAKLDVNGNIRTDGYDYQIQTQSAWGSWERGFAVVDPNGNGLARFGVYGSAYGSADYSYIGSSYSNPIASFKTSGSVGIATTAPSAKLDVVGGGIKTDSSVTTPLVFSNSGNLSLTPTTASYGVVVTQGTFSAPTIYQNGVQVIDTTTAGGGISISGSTNSRTISLSNSGVTAGTYPKVTVDTYGRVTTGTTLSATDIPSLDTSKLTTGTLPIARGGTNTTATPTAGTVVYGTGSAQAYTAAGTATQVLVSNGASAPSFVTLDMSYLPDAAFKKSVKAATTANITLSAPQTIDGISVVAGDRVLVKDQTASYGNGIYIVQAAAWTRAVDADTSSEIAGAVVNVDQGTANGGVLYENDFKTTDTLGTTNMLWNALVDTNRTQTLANKTMGSGSTWNGNAITVPYGGTGATSFTAGRLIFGNGTSALNTSANIFWDNTNSRLGIGTASPISALHVKSANASTTFENSSVGQVSIENTNGNTYYSTIDFKGNQSVPIARIGVLQTGSGSYMSLGTSNNYSSGITNTSVNIDYSGNVGVGKTPSYKMDVNGIVSGTTLMASTAVISSTVYGSQSANGSLILESTLDATKGNVSINPNGGNVIIGSTSSSVTIPGNLTVTGNLEVQGTRTFLNTTELNVKDKVINLAYGATTDTAANGGGLLIHGATNKTILYGSTNGDFTSSENFNLASGKRYRINNVDIANVSETLTNKTIGSGSTWYGNVIGVAYGGTGLTSVASAGSIIFSNGTAFASDTSNFYWDDTNNRMGIGTSSPSSKLDVVGGGIKTDSSVATPLVMNANTTGTIDLTLQSATGNIELLPATGYGVGIGTTTPMAQLHVYKSNSGNIGGEIMLDNNNSAVGNATAITFSDGGGASLSYNRAQIKAVTENAPYYGQLQFLTGIGTLTQKMVITGTGSVGIGTTNPGYNLDVNGTLRASGDIYQDRAMFIKDFNGTSDSWWGWYAWDKEFQFNKRNSSNAFVNNIFTANWDTNNFNITNGSLGVNVSSPTEKLEVAGNIKANAISGTAVSASTQFVSTVATGTAPMQVASTTKVTNLNVDYLDGYDASTFTTHNEVTDLGTVTFNQAGTTTADFITKLESLGAFDNFYSIMKATWDYAGNTDLSDTGFGAFDLAGCVVETWTDNSDDVVRGNIHVRVTRPTTGAGGGQILVYNDQGSGYSPGWRQLWTSTTDGTGSGLDADLLDGLHSTSFMQAASGTTNYVTKFTGANAVGNSLIYDNGTNIGIGTTSPAAKLDIRGNSSTNTYDVPDGYGDLRILSSNNRAYDGGIIAIGGSSGVTGFIKTAATNVSAGNLVIGNRRLSTDTFMTAGIVLDTSGYVGINDMTPTERLEVVGNIKANAISGTAVSASTQFVSTVATGTAPMQVASTTKVTNLNADYLDGYDSSSFVPRKESDSRVYTASAHTYFGGATGIMEISLPNTLGRYHMMYMELNVYSNYNSANNGGKILINVYKDTSEGINNPNITYIGNFPSYIANIKSDAGALKIYLGDASTNWSYANIEVGKIILNDNVSGVDLSGITMAVVTGLPSGTVAMNVTKTRDLYDATSSAVASTLLKRDSSGNVSANAIYGTAISASTQFVSTVATGTAPMQVASSTTVTNLSADMLDGNHNGDVTAKWINYNNTAYGNSQVQFMQLSSQNAAGDNFGTGWASIIKMNHGDGDTYYNRTLAFDFFSNNIYTRMRQGGTASGWSKLWMDSNDGSGSGLDSDTLDGVHSTGFMQSASGTTNYVTKFTGANSVGNSQIFDNGTNIGIGTTTLTEKLTVSGNISASAISGTAVSASTQFVSTVATGTAPMQVTSTTKVTNLNADYLDGYSASSSASANTIVLRDSNNYIYANYINSNRGDETTAAASYIYDTGDGWMRKKTLANVKTEIVTNAAVIAGLGYTPVNKAGDTMTGSLTVAGSVNITGAQAYIQLNSGSYIQENDTSFANAVSYVSRSGYTHVFRNGNVGIGVVPTEKLEVSGNIKSSGYMSATTFTASTAVNTPLLYNASGTLNVSGNVAFTGTIGQIGPSSNNPENGTWNPIWTAIASGRPIYGDEEFASGNNSVSVYNNSGGDGVVITRELGDGSQPNTSGYWLKIVNNGNATSPGLGGFYQNITARRNATLVQRFRAKVPIGYTLVFAENPQGTNNTSYWLTPVAGTGKWEEYIRVSHTGNTGTFSGGGHIYLTGSPAVVTWYLASSEIYEVDSPGTSSITNMQIKDVAWGKLTSIPTASTSVSGILSSTDWNTFNNKQAALGYTPVNKAGDTMTGALNSSAEFYTSAVFRTSKSSGGQFIGNWATTNYWGLGTTGANQIRLGAYNATGTATSETANLTVAGSVSASAFYYSSDRTLKENIKPIENSLTKLLQLSGYTFNWKSDEDKKVHIGLIAQEVEKVFPEAVKTDEETGLKSIEYANMVAPIIEGVKDQQSQIEELKKANEDQQKQIDELKKQIDLLIKKSK